MLDIPTLQAPPYMVGRGVGGIHVTATSYTQSSTLIKLVRG